MPTVPYNIENNDDKLAQTENVGRIKSFITEGVQNEFGNNRTQSQNESVNRIQNFIRSGFNEDDIKLTYNLGLKKSKSEAAEGLNNRGLDIPQTLSADERKELLSRQKLEDLNPEQLRMIAPSFSRWVEGDIERAALTQDDIKQLSYIEKHWEFIREQYTVGDLTTELSNLGAKDALLGLDENERKRRDEIKQRMAQSGDFGFSLGEDTIGFMANQLPIFRESLMGKVKAAAVGGAAGGVTAATGALIAGQLGPQAATPEEVVTVPGAFLAGAKPGIVTGWRYGAMIAAAKMEFGLAYDEFKDIKIDEFNTIDKPTAVGAAAAVGMINGALEGFGFEQLAKRIPGLNKLSRGGVKKLMKTPGVRQALTGYFKIVGQAMATEGSTEFLQEMTKDVAGGLVEIMNSDSKSDMTIGEILSQLFSSENLAKWKEAGIRGAQVGGGITATTNAAYYGGKGAVRQVNKAMKARADAKALENMENAIEETDLKKMSPKESGNYLKQVASDNGIEKVYVPVEKFEALFQSKVDKNGNPIKPEDAANSIGVDLNTYNEALQNGGDIAIPIEQWGEKVLGTDISKSLVRDVRLKPEGMTSNEAVEYFSERDQVELEKQQAAQLEETEQLKVNIKDRMIKVGFRGNVAESYADVFSEFYSTLAQRKGITVNEAWETYGFNISNEAVEKVDADNVLFQTLAQDDRGRLTFNGVEMNIELLKNPDLSTVMHEAGHVFVEVLAKIDQEQDAPQQIKDDFKTLIEWAGFESVEKWHESDLNTRRDAHEKIADGFLNYLKEGKAPSSALRQAFNRIKDWLGHLFRTGQFRDIELNKDVRAVFDRMLSTDEEIEAAKAENNILSLFQNPEQFGLTGKAGKEFVQKLQEATLNARETMHAKVVDEYNKKVSQGSKLLKETIRQEILESLNNNPIYSALTILGTGKLPDGTILDKPMKLSKKALVAIYGKDILKKMRKPYLYADDTGKNVRKNVNIVHPDTAAQALGFDSAEQMFDQILNAKPMDEFVEQQVEARFEQESGVLLTNEEIEQTANEVVNGEKNSEIMQMELEFLASDKFASGVGLAEKIARKVPSIAVIKERARDVISQRKFRDIKPREFLSNVSKANKEAFRALKNKDFAAAFDARARALYNQELYNEAVRVREYTEKKLRYVRKFKKDSKRRQIGKYDPEALEQIDDILSRYRLDKTLSMIKVDKAKTLVEYMAKLANLGYPQSALDQKVLDDARKIDYRDMTIEEFRGLIGTMEYIDNAAIQANKLLTEKSKLTLEQTVEGITASIYANFTGGKANKAGVETLKSKLFGFVKKYGAEHVKVDMLIELLDGGEYNGALGKAVWNKIASARNIKYKIQQRLSDGLRTGIFEKIYTPKELANLSRSVYVASANNGTHKGTFTIADIMTLALNMGTEEGQQRVANFGFSDSTMAEIFSHLTSKDLDAIQSIWVYLDKMWPEIAQHEQDVNGIKPEKVKAKRVTINGREMSGGYYPLRYDSDTNERQKQLDDKTTVQEAFGQSYTHAMTKQGHLNARLEQVDKTIRLGFEVLGAHLDDVAHDLAFRKPVMDVARIIDNKTFQAAVVDAVGNDLYRQFKSWLVDVANDNTGSVSNNARLIDKFARTAKDAAAVVNMGFKLTTMIVQPLGYLQSVDTIGKKWAMRGLRDSYSNPLKILKTYKEIAALSPMMANRISNYNRDVNEFMRRTKIIGATPGKIGSINHKYRQLSETYFYGIAALDMAVAIPTWKGAYEQAMAGEATNVTKGDMDQAIAYADAMVERSQGSGDVKNLAAIQRGSPAQKLFTMYYSYFSINLQRMIKAGFNVIKTGDIPQFISSMMLLWFAPVALESLILGRHPGEDADDEDWYRFYGKVATYPIQGIVGLREIGSLIDGYGAGSSTTSDYLYSIGAGIGSAAKLGAGVFSDDIEIKRSDYKNIVMGSAYAFRLPGRQMWLTGEYMVDWINGENNPENLPIGLWEMTVTGKKRK